jgi:uracil-DNA glycosylase
LVFKVPEESNPDRDSKKLGKLPPEYFVLPHPSSSNKIWLKKNPWYEKNLVPKSEKRVREILF